MLAMRKPRLINTNLIINSALSLLGRESYDESFMDRADATTPLILPGFGETDDQDAAPLGTGIAVLSALGAAYLVGKKRKEA